MSVDVDDLVGPQRDVYEGSDERLLVLGGPGTGKTLVALLTARRIAEEDASGRRVLFLTFSRAATSELFRRAPNVLGDMSERVEVTTFHGFAVNLLDAFRRYAGGPEVPLTIATREEVDLGVAEPGSAEFDELIPTVLELFEQAPWILDLYRDRLAAVICDEFQDTRDEQYALLERLAAGRRLICLADPEQMIFDGLPGAGSIVRRIDEFRATGPRVIDLGEKSYRDPSQVIPAAAAAIRERRYDEPALLEALANRRISIELRDPPPQDHLVELIEAALVSGAESVGVFFRTNRQVNEFADRLRRDGLEHEIAGLTHASGEAELVAATLAELAVGRSSWNDMLRRLGVFLASTTRGRPPDVARQLVDGEAAIDEGLLALLQQERDRVIDMRPRTVGSFLLGVREFWPRVFRGGGQRLWEIGIDDLLSEALHLRDLDLDAERAADLMEIAARRRATAALDNLPGVEAPIRVMNLHQVKGRQMDVSVIVRELGEYEPGADSQRLRRLVYVAISRARQQAIFLLPNGITGYFAEIAGLASALEG